ncbi:MAG TPA: hypothetical protein DHV03_05235 [Alphaproteobacteria bacterium]|nr:hypothetical protein [Alphaproteobacteria bacterium]
MGVAMNNIFLGKLVHWLVLLAVVPPGIIAGINYFHVVQFNWFILGVGGFTFFAIIIILATTKPDELVTREPIPDDHDVLSKKE